MRMLKFLSACCVAIGMMIPSVAYVQADIFVDVDDSTGAWNGFMNVYNITTNGDAANGQGAAVFGSGWGLADLNSEFDDAADKLTLSPNTIADPNEFWYQNTTGTAPDPANPGGPGQLGNKFMEANLFQAFGNGTPELAVLQADGTLVFQGEVLMNTLTAAHISDIFIKEFAPDFSSVSETAIPLTPGIFSVSHSLTGLGGEVQYGFRTVGENVWSTDVAPFGNAMISTAPLAVVPEPGSITLLGLGLAGFAIRRRR